MKKCITVILVCILFIMQSGLTLGNNTDAEVYGVNVRDELRYNSVEELQIAVATQYEAWTKGLENCDLRNDDMGVVVTLDSGNYAKYRDMTFWYSEDVGAWCSLRYEGNREEMNLYEVECMVEFVCSLFSGETGGFPGEVAQNIKSVKSKNPDAHQIQYFFKRINGINYTYSSKFESQLMKESTYNILYMTVMSYAEKEKLYIDSEDNVKLSFSDLINGEGDYQKLPGTGSGWYCVKGRLENTNVDQEGIITGILTDGTNKAPVTVNGYRMNSVEEYKNADVFYIRFDSQASMSENDGPSYIAIYCQ